MRLLSIEIITLSSKEYSNFKPNILKGIVFHGPQGYDDATKYGHP